MSSAGPAISLAKSEVVTKTSYSSPAYKIHAELYFDKEKKRADLWVEWEQGRTAAERVAFRATSLDERLKDAEIMLKPSPAAHIDGETILVFYGFEKATGDFHGSRGFSLIFKLPAEHLAEETLDHFKKHFPKSIVSDAAGKPKYLKGVLCRITSENVYPVAAFDAELELPKRN